LETYILSAQIVERAQKQPRAAEQKHRKRDLQADGDLRKRCEFFEAVPEL
jgi:hypothetical protein